MQLYERSLLHSLLSCKCPLDRNFSNIYETRPIIFGNILLTITFVKTPTRGGIEFCLVLRSVKNQLRPCARNNC